MTRFLLSSLAALALLAPVAASAAPRATVHHIATHSTRHSSHMTGRHATRTRDGGSAAVDQLNQQSLDRARASDAAPAAPAAPAPQ